MMSRQDRKLLDDAKRIIMSKKDVPGGMEEIRQLMNTIYKYFKRVITKADFNDKRLVEIFTLERLLKDRYLPLDNEPIYDEDREVVAPSSITTEDDCIKMMECIVHRTRKDLSELHNLKRDSLENNCIDSSWKVQENCAELGVKQTTYHCSESLKTGVFHCFNVVNFELPNGETKYYLVDCTYRQFFTYAGAFLERIGLPLNEGPSMGTYMMMDERRKKIAEEILTKGFIEFTPEVIKAYFDAFIFAGRNGLYYDSLGKQNLTKEDYEPYYTCDDYIYALSHGGIKEEHIGRQFGYVGDTVNYEYVDTKGVKLT
jgi:hypothetical protein